MQTSAFNLVERPALEQLKKLGWTCQHGTAFEPGTERSSLSQVILPARLGAALSRINPTINAERKRQVLRSLCQPSPASLIEANHQFWKMLVHSDWPQSGTGPDRHSESVKLIDFDNLANNEFLCVNQLEIEGRAQRIVADIVLFVNGMPLAVIEAISPLNTDPVQQGIGQLMAFANRHQPDSQQGAEQLFRSNQFMVSSCHSQARVGTISSMPQHYLEWKDAYPLPTHPNASSQHTLIDGLFCRATFLDLIRHFTWFETMDGRTVKRFARYQQNRAVNKTIQRIKTGRGKKGKGGVIWHTQGSGKSLTMIMLANKMRNDQELKDHKLVFITDRSQLDLQLTDQLERAQDGVVCHADTMESLRTLLSRDGADLITATVQKFQEKQTSAFAVLNKSEKIIVLVDEAHRTQYGCLGVAINAALPNAPKIAFTGTPLIRAQKTCNEFGAYIDTYSTRQAVADGSTCQILYEGRHAKTRVDATAVDQEFEACLSDSCPELKAAVRKKNGTEQTLLETPQRIRWICRNLIEHYRSHIEPNGFKAMIVASSRRAAILYKQTIDELAGPQCAVIISGTRSDADFYTAHTDPARHKRQIADFKKPLTDNPLSILIVKDMLLTGFDAPLCQVMYLDHKLREHALLQAIARVNRSAAGKSCGYIIDYVGLSDYLNEAMELFSARDMSGAWRDIRDEIPRLIASHTRVMQHFGRVDIGQRQACERKLNDAQIRQQFNTDFNKFAHQMDIVMPDAAARPFLHDLGQLGKIRQSMAPHHPGTERHLDELSQKVRTIIDRHVTVTGIDTIIEEVDLWATVNRTRAAPKLAQKSQALLIDVEQKNYIDIYLPTPELLSASLEQQLQRNSSNWTELVHKVNAASNPDRWSSESGAQAADLCDTEFAFQQILEFEVLRRHESGTLNSSIHSEIISITRRLVRMLDQASKTIDFFKKHDEVKRVRNHIKRCIIESSFDDEQLRQIVMDRFLDLARLKFK